MPDTKAAEGTFDTLSHAIVRLAKEAEFCKQTRLEDRSGRPYLLVTAPVAVPNKLDTDDDWIEKEEIEQMSHEFMASCQQHGYRHMTAVSKEDAVIVESYVLRKDEMFGIVLVKEGSWVVTSRVYEESLINGIENGTIKGFSFGATGEYVDEAPPSLVT